MAGVMNEIGNSNGEIDEENEGIKLNGDTCDEATNIRDISSDDGDVEEPSTKDINGSKKLITEAYEDGKIYASDKPANAVANGHFKSQSTKANSIADGEESEETANCDNDSGDKAEEPELRVERAEEQIDPVVENNHDSEVKSDSDDSSENLALNLKTTSNQTESDVSDGVEKVLPAKDGLAETSISVVEEPKKDKPNDVEDDDDEDEVEEEDVISIYSTPDKSKKLSKKSSPLPAVSITPRRSSRNLNKQRSSYSDYDDNKKRNEDDEIEEVTPTDPLADEPKSRMRNNKTIVVSDTKGLVEFASSAKASRSNKKEPTLVIIDTNSILSGRGPIPVSQSSSSLMHSSSTSTPIPVSLPISAGSFANAARGSNSSSSSAFSVIPLGLPAQGMYSQFKNPPPQIKPIVVGPASTTVTPVPMSTTVASTTVTAVTTTPTPKQPPVILPSLTDDMFVVEAPSFIVPYVYEKPPMKSLKEHIDKIKVDIKEAEQKEEKERQEREEKENEKADKPVDEEESDGKSESDVPDSAETEKAKEESEKSDDQPMEVDELSDSGASVKTPSETEIVPVAGKKTEADKKEEISAVVAKEVDKKLASAVDDSKKPASYFENPLGKFFMQIGLNLVQEHVQTDLLRSQKRRRDKEGDKCSPDINSAIDELTKTLESSKENNDPFKLELKKCELCSFKTESLLVMAHHLETPHMKNYTYRCNFCTMEIRSPQDILVHMEAEHNIRGRLERAPAFHQCPNCPFEDNQKGKLTRHLISCSKKYRPERNQEPPLDWEPPAKIPRVTRNRPPSMSPGNAVYQAAMSGLKQVPQNTLLPKLMPNTANMKHNMLNSNKRPSMAGNFVNRFPNANNQPNFQQRPISVQTSNQGMMYRPSGGSNSQTQVLLPQGYQLSGAQIYQNTSTKQQSQQGLAAAKLLNQPSISITPLPRQTSSSASGSSSSSSGNVKPGKPTTNAGGKSAFVVCEICDGYIKDLDQLRNHMQWIHKVKIHPKMIYNRPPLNCQKCQYRFFTDQGLERHLLGSHGLVTSSMQEAANKGKDGGRCPVCGRVYQWKLLNHVARDHQMGLKPAHLSYKCTVCTATFGMYKQFESHVYSAHSVVAKRAMDTSKKPPTSQPSQNETLLKPLKINDEITIIPQPVRAAKPSNKPSNSTISASVTSNKGKNLEDEQYCKCACLMEDFANNAEFRQHVYEKHLKSFTIKISRIDLKRLSNIPNKENAFKLNTPIAMEELKRRFGLKDFSIKINRHRVSAEVTYKVPGEDEMASNLLPEVTYADPNVDAGKSDTLYVKRMKNRFQRRKPAAKKPGNSQNRNPGFDDSHFLGTLLGKALERGLTSQSERTKCSLKQPTLLNRTRIIDLTTAFVPKRQAVKKSVGGAPLIQFSTPVDNTRSTAVNFVTQLKSAQCLVNYQQQMIKVRTENFSSMVNYRKEVIEVVHSEKVSVRANSSSTGQNDVISLLSDSESDSGSSDVEIVETEEYILPV